MIRTRRLFGTGLVVVAIGMTTAVGVMAKGPRTGRGDLSGYQEIPTLSTPATGSIEVTIAPDDSSLSYVLTYEGFETDVTQAHIHLGRPAFSGGVMVFFCTNAAVAPAGIPAPPKCPVRGGTVTGTLTAADVFTGASAQGVTPGEFSEVLDALRIEAAYANVHTTRFPAGEIRGQILFHGAGSTLP